MLVAIIALYYLHFNATGVGTFDYVVLLNSMKAGNLSFPPQTGTLLFFAFRARLFDQSSGFPVSHLAARRAHRSTDCRFGNFSRRSFENGNLRFDAV